MEFFVSLIAANEQDEPAQRTELEENCTYITENYWFYEGDLDALSDYGVRFELVEENIAVPSLGGLTEKELMELAGVGNVQM
ncbi:hypothetical protein NVP1250O_77 [Vibrio phage 1.250.O._10N.261.55.E11]|nr:hypothetical protein NVP1250O_77 [Vibrio phage 1.250.O._10N.261.55.E11]